ncbi:phage integrase N-terminal SAM-like domain-containing protein, partial [Candidatus Amarolinea dominans]|uniref:site-specific integrase n=1 Tax=Candidatus Amarolinea dominans TaxID=3140696 RepID=UPI00313580C4|nr:phage integrase N-terminal SAM-like domain-containing protein [Anaerolineae bacterium]
MKNIITTDTTTTPKAAMTDLDAALLAGQCAPSTISMYQRDAAAYIAWCKSAGVAPVDSISLARWRTHLATATTMSPNTINRMLSAVKRIVREGASQGFTTQE